MHQPADLQEVAFPSDLQEVAFPSDQQPQRHPQLIVITEDVHPQLICIHGRCSSTADLHPRQMFIRMHNEKAPTSSDVRAFV